MPTLAFTKASFLSVCLCISVALFSHLFAAQQPPIPPAPPAAAARTLLLPRRLVAGERSTLAVLDVNGRLTPGVTVTFSTGDSVTTDSTGRALFVAPLNPGVLRGSLTGRRARVGSTILNPASAPGDRLGVRSAPRIAALSDRFELWGTGFCGDADANHVTIRGRAALVLAASPASLTVLPPENLEPGPAMVSVACRQRSAESFSMTLVSLRLDAASAPLAPGEKRTLLVRIQGAKERVTIEGRNFAPRIAELDGGNLVRVTSTGGAENVARFELIGRARGSFRVSFRLVASLAPPRP